MHHIPSVDRLSDSELLAAVERVAVDDRHLTAELLALLGELDVRRLYLGQSCASLFTYCTQALHFSEHAAYHRIEAARAARQCPVILEMVAAGDLTLTTVTLLRPHLTSENCRTLLEAARHKSKREVEQQIARHAPRQGEPTIVRKLMAPVQRPSSSSAATPSLIATSPLSPAAVSTSAIELRPRSRAVVTPLSPKQYLLKVTLSVETHAKLRRAQDLLRHTIPAGDTASVIDRALTVLVDALERTKIARTSRRSGTSRPVRRSAVRGQPQSRYVPSSIRRAVWDRDGGRCAFVGARGRCTETSRLEFHHVIPFADGGPTSLQNLSLRCQAHNAHEAQLWSPT